MPELPRKAALSELEPGPDNVHTFQFDEFQVNLRLRALFRSGEKVRLSAKPFATLEFLVENRHRVVSKTELLEKVWRGRREVSTVEHALGKIREALGDDPSKPRYVETVTGHGYRFIAAMRPEPDETLPGVSALHTTRRSLLVAAGLGAPLACLAGFAADRTGASNSCDHRTPPVTFRADRELPLKTTRARRSERCKK
jgi:DNA-binding winged helix-turn-helix (wHTH) protein